MNICNCKKDLEAYLCDIPAEWREGIVNALCYVYADTCEDDVCVGIKECETLTFLSPFSVQDDTISISYKSEKYTSTKSFDLIPVIDNTLDTVDPFCLTTDEEWADLSFVERLELLISKRCECCPPVTTTTTSTSTTTTTTAAPTTTTTTTSTSTTTTTSTSSTTTTTTSHPVADFVARNISSDSTLDDVTPVFYSISTGAFPLSPTQEVTGTHNGFSGVISAVVTVGTTPNYLRLEKDGALVACRLVTHSGTFAFSSQTFLNTEECRVILTSTPPDEPSAFCP